jgi:hypothetical protein
MVSPSGYVTQQDQEKSKEVQSHSYCQGQQVKGEEKIKEMFRPNPKVIEAQEEIGLPTKKKRKKLVYHKLYT